MECLSWILLCELFIFGTLDMGSPMKPRPRMIVRNQNSKDVDFP